MRFLCSVMSSSSMSITNATLSTVDERYWASFKWKSIFSFLLVFCSISLRLLIIISNTSSQKRIIKLVNSSFRFTLCWVNLAHDSRFTYLISFYFSFPRDIARQSLVAKPRRIHRCAHRAPCSVKCNFSHECRLTSYVIWDECGIFLNGFMKLS